MLTVIVQFLISDTLMTVTTMSGPRTMRQLLLAKQEKLLMKPPPMELAGKVYPTAYVFLLSVVHSVWYGNW